MKLRDCYKVLGLEPGVDMAAVKRAYRRLAFSLHPDLNPDVPDAARRFQEVNEAYVRLTQAAADSKARRTASDAAADTARVREEAQKAYARARQGQDTGTRATAATGSGAGSEGGEARKTGAGPRAREEVLKDILNDPFARRVFEDIYSHIRKEDPSAQGARPGAAKPGTRTGRKPAPGQARAAQMPGASVFGKFKGWLLKQIDDQQTVRLPRESLVPGARVRLEIQHGLGGDPQVVEITLPPEFVPGRAMRLKGMGRRLGNLRGDLYVRIEAI
jgi:molecular chaperone DnaJ